VELFNAEVVDDSSYRCFVQRTHHLLTPKPSLAGGAHSLITVSINLSVRYKKIHQCLSVPDNQQTHSVPTPLTRGRVVCTHCAATPAADTAAPIACGTVQDPALSSACGTGQDPRRAAEGRAAIAMPRGVLKANLPSKICETCQKPFTWRKVRPCFTPHQRLQHALKYLPP
jgi:hypothetical protein